MTAGQVVLGIGVIAAAFDLCPRLFRGMGLSARGAGFFCAAALLCSFLPPPAGAAAVGLGAACMAYRAHGYRLRTCAAAGLIALFTAAAGRMVPSLFLQSWQAMLYAVAAGLMAYLIARMRGASFAAGCLGMLLGSLLQPHVPWGWDEALIAGTLALLCAHAAALLPQKSA